MRSGNHLVDIMDDDMNNEARMLAEDRAYCFDCESSPCKCSEYKEARQKELEAYCPTFDSFLSEKHIESISNTEDDCLDDDFPDAFDNWFGGLDTDDLMPYANLFGIEMNIRGYKECHDNVVKSIDRITAK